MIPEFEACIHATSGKMKTEDVKSCINELLFNPSPEQVDNELLTIVLLKEKARHLDFLKGYTKWNTVGTWEQYPNEKNVLIEVQFKDTKDERVGNKLMELLERLNRKEIKEEQIYARTTPIEETTLH